MCSLVVLCKHVMRTYFKYVLMRMFIRVPGERTVTEGTFLKASDHSLIDIFWIDSAWPSANPDACVCA